MTILPVRQGVAKWLGYAILCVRSVISDARVAVAFLDMILDDYIADQAK